MGEYVLTCAVGTRFNEDYDHAMRILRKKQKTDGVAPFERVLYVLLEMLGTSRYERVLQVGFVKRRYNVTHLVPDFPARGMPSHLLKQDLEDTELLRLPALKDALIDALNRTRHDLRLKHFQVTAPTEGQMLAAMVLLVAGTMSRRWKSTINQRYLPLAG